LHCQQPHNMPETIPLSLPQYRIPELAAGSYCLVLGQGGGIEPESWLLTQTPNAYSRPNSDTLRNEKRPRRSVPE
jgi:hypothetical protein